MMLEKGKVYEADILDYTVEGMGVARVEGCAVFVPNAIVGEKCQLRIEKLGKTWASAKIASILEKSPHRLQRGGFCFTAGALCAIMGKK